MARTKTVFNKKRPQLRRCAFCDKIGHNKSTCPVFLATQKERIASIPRSSQIKLFVHHISNQPATSPHVINLKDKNKENEEIPSVSPRFSNKEFQEAYKTFKNNLYAQSNKPQAKIELTKKENKPRVSHQSINSRVLQNFAENYNLSRQTRQSSKLGEYIGLSIESAAHDLKRITEESFYLIKRYLPAKNIAAVIAILALIAISPGPVRSFYEGVTNTKDRIVEQSASGFSSLQSSTVALMQSDLPQAQTSINNALNSFGDAVDTMNSKYTFLQSLISAVPKLKDEVGSRQSLLLAGQKISLGNTYIIKGISDNQLQPTEKLTNRLNTMITHLRAAIPNYESALINLSEVNQDVLPLAYQASFGEFKQLFATILNDFKNIAELGESMQEIFGGEGTRKYILVFQNQNEIRPTGGFIGSFAILDVKDGQIINFEVPAGGSYDLQGQLDKTVEPPAPLLLANKRWEFQDANWYPDFSASAEKILWFYRHSRNTTADGVIAINATVLERLLSIMGPIQDLERNISLNSENAIQTIQNIVENSPEKQQNKPKQILSDLAPQFLQYLQNIEPKDLLPVFAHLQESLTKKEIQAYFTDEPTQKKVASYGWGGKILDTKSDQDYLMIVNTNVQGQKSDAKIKQHITHQSVIDENGEIINTVVITREHQGNSMEKLYGVTNINFLRLYVPQGSELLSASGFSWPDDKHFKAPDTWAEKDEDLSKKEKEIKIDEKTGTRITDEFGKTSFGNWTITEPGATTQIVFTYRLPFKATLQNIESSGWKKLIGGQTRTAKYQLVLQKQSGCDTTFESQIVFPETWRTYWHEGDKLEIANNGMIINKTKIDKDKIWGVVMKTK